ncbi:helix-turn-helix domain-containing protein [Pedobacter sp. ASV1-7]|uniref:helix-turn-helix domain-containing protein n=1 Tax=Pedobacter sp. ASV1-7 TaxID=3145237 RepID=UPI0032E8A56F
MAIDNMVLNNAQILIPATEFSDTIKNIFEQVLREHNNCVVAPIVPNNDEKEELLTRKQIANLLNISLPTLDLRIKDGVIPSYRIGKKLLFDKKAVLHSIEKLGRTK